MAATVNKDEMARRMGVSLPTLTGMMKDNEDFPIAAGGSRGVPYAFNVADVLEWKKRKAEEARQIVADKNEFLSQFEFEEPEETTAATPAQRLQMANAMRVERKMAMESGQLVLTASMRQAIQIALAVLGKRLDNIPGQLGREFNLPDGQQRAVKRYLDDARTALIREIKESLGAAPEAESAELFAAE